MAEATFWRQYPDIGLRTPVLAVAPAVPAVAAGPAASTATDGAEGVDGADGRLWLGGMGGIGQVVTAGTALAPEPAVPGLTTVAALCTVGSWLIAGVADGILRCRDGAYELAEVQSGGAPVAALLAVPSGGRPAGDPDGDHDPNAVLLLAATLGDGVLRSDDRGRTWVPANFGLDDTDVSALVAGPGGTVLAGTANGVFAATSGLRAWRRCPGTEGTAVAALTYAVGSSQVCAAGEKGETLRSVDGGRTWSAGGPIPAQPTAIATAPDGSLVAGTAGSGVWRSVDGGLTWSRADDGRLVETVYCLVSVGTVLHAGTAEGLASSTDGGLSWAPVAVPSTHDLDRVLVRRGRPVVAGGGSGVVELGATGGWAPLDGAPFPLTATAVAPDGALLASGPAGLFRHVDQEEWEPVVPGESGHVGVLTFRADGRGWAAPARHGDALLHTTDGGATWESVPAPFGALPLTALQAVEGGGVLAATTDRRQGSVQLWASADDGTTWLREARAETPWPVVDSLGEPGLLSLGRALCVRDRNGEWSQWAELDDGVRAVAGDRSGVVVLTPGGIWTVTDDGRPDARLDEGVAVDEVLDIEVADGILVALLTEGRVWWRPIRRDASTPELTEAPHPTGSGAL